MYNDPSNAVVHLTMRFEKTELAVGSGVLYRQKEQYYIVTAWHNVTGRHPDDLSLLSDEAALPNNIIAYVCCKMFSGEQVWYGRMPFSIQLEDEEKALYFIHQQPWPRIDVVAIPINPETPYPCEFGVSTGGEVCIDYPMRYTQEEPELSCDIECIQDFEGAISSIPVDFSQHLEASDDLFILGYPRGIIDYSGQPIWKRATVATSPQRGWNKQKQFLVDCASREGMSGAPTLFYSREGKVQISNTTHMGLGPVAYFHGVYTGRLGVESGLEAQIGTIWQRSLVDELIEDKVYGVLSSEIELPMSEIRGLIQSTWPDNPDFAGSILENEYQQGFYTHELMTKLKGRANPRLVKEELLEIAKEKLEGS